MSFAIFTDGCSNLPGDQIRKYQIRVLPCTYTLDGVQHVYNGDIDSFDAPAHYNLLRAGHLIQTSLINSQLFADHFRVALEEGLDVIYVGLSSGVSGTYNAARLAAEELNEEYPNRKVRTVDSRGAAFGPGLLTLMAADLREEGKDAEAAAEELIAATDDLCEYFTVDDLMFLNRTGRLSGAGAMVGTMLNIKPILRGDEEGHIVSYQKIRGRKKAVDTLVKIYGERVVDAANQRVGITHGDCPEEAKLLAERICEVAKPKELLVCPHEPFTGSHVGPGMLAVYFFGKGR